MRIALFLRPIMGLFAGAVLLAGTALAQNAPLDLSPDAPSNKKKPAAQGEAPATTESVEALTPKQIVQRANAYFNGMDSFAGDFIQTNEDGRRFKGKLMVARPGKMRFDYAPPAKVLILSDGSTVAVVDERLRTKDRYPIGQTPLKFLLDDQINISKDLKLIRAKAAGGEASITVEDRTTFGGTSRITILFDQETFALTGWRVTDGQGVTTKVGVSNIKRGVSIPEKNFEITDEDIFLKLQKGGQ
jgi:outer membrane lipoprotein-sorting protein